MFDTILVRNIIFIKSEKNNVVCQLWKNKKKITQLIDIVIAFCVRVKSDIHVYVRGRQENYS